MSLKRVFLRLQQTYAEFDEVNLLNKLFCSIGSDVPDAYVHLQISDSKHFHFILDINATQEINPDLQEISHEVYKVTFNDKEP